MKIWFKRILISLVVVLIVALVGAAIFLLTFDPNAYKSKLEEIVYERYHRTLTIDGDIELSLFPRIGLAVQDVSLSDRDSTDVFASLGSARFAVAIWPLLSNRLVVDHVAVSGFKAWLVRDHDGNFNFSDLIASPPRLAPLASDSSALAHSAFFAAGGAMPRPQQVLFPAVAAEKPDLQIDIAGLDLKGGEIHLHDQVSGAVGRLVQLDVNTGRMTFDQAFDVALKGKLLGDAPRADATLEGQALLRMDPLQRVYSAQRINLQVSGQLGDLNARTASLRGDLAYSDYSRMLNVGALEVLLQGDTDGDEPIKGLDASLAVPQLRMDRSQAELKVSRLALRIKGQQADSAFDIALNAPSLSVSPEAASAEPLSGTLKVTGPSDVLGISLDMSGLGGNAYDLTLNELKLQSAWRQGKRAVIVDTSSPAAWSPFRRRGGLSAIKGDIRIEDAGLPSGSFQFPFIGSMQTDLYEDTLSADIDAVLSGSKINFNLTANQLSDPHLVFDLVADKIDLNTLFPPPPRDSEADADDADTNDETPAERVEPPATASVPVRQLDWSFLNAASVQGKVAIQALRAGELEVDELRATVDVRDGSFKVGDITAGLYGGTLESALEFNADHSLSVDVAGKGVDVGPLTRALMRRQRLAGTGDFSVKLSAQGGTIPALVAGLNGQTTLRVHDGAWLGLDLARTITEANNVLRNVFSGQLPKIASRYDPSRRTSFDDLQTHITFAEGQGKVDQLTLTSPSVHVVQGTPASIDLVNQQMDVVLDVRATGTQDQAPEALSVLKNVVVPVRIAGPFDAPAYTVQWQDIRDRVVKDAIQEGLLDTLLRTSGDVADSFLNTPAEKDAPASSDTLKNIGKALRGLLGR